MARVVCAEECQPSFSPDQQHVQVLSQGTGVHPVHGHNGTWMHILLGEQASKTCGASPKLRYIKTLWYNQ